MFWKPLVKHVYNTSIQVPPPPPPEILQTKEIHKPWPKQNINTSKWIVLPSTINIQGFSIASETWDIARLVLDNYKLQDALNLKDDMYKQMLNLNLFVTEHGWEAWAGGTPVWNTRLNMGVARASRVGKWPILRIKMTKNWGEIVVNIGNEEKLRCSHLAHLALSVWLHLCVLG